MANDQLNHAAGGFTAIPNSVLHMVAEGDLSRNGLVLYLYLTYRIHNERQVAFPSYDTIAKDLDGWSRATISKTLNELQEVELIEKRRRFSSSTIYTVLVPKMNHSSTENELLEVQKLNATNNETTNNENTNTGEEKASSPPGEEKTTSPPEQTTSKRNGKTDPRVKPLLEAFTELIGYPLPNYGQEGAAAKKMLKAGYEPTEILACWEYMQKDNDFWEDKHCGLASVNKQIGKWRDNHATNGKRVIKV